MNRLLPAVLSAAWLALAAVAVAQAADPADAGEARLRDTLRSTMLQLRDAQSDLANLQAAQAAQADENKALADQLALIKKHSAEDRAAADKVADGLKAKVEAQAAELARLQASLAEWKAKAEQTGGLVQAALVDRTKLEVQNAALQRQVDDLELKNLTLFQLGNEILTRYQKFSLGEQFLAREPFIGRTRVALENQIQGYEDKLASLQVTP